MYVAFTFKDKTSRQCYCSTTFCLYFAFLCWFKWIIIWVYHFNVNALEYPLYDCRAGMRIEHNEGWFDGRFILEGEGGAGTLGSPVVASVWRELGAACTPPPDCTTWRLRSYCGTLPSLFAFERINQPLDVGGSQVRSQTTIVLGQKVYFP